MKQSAEDKIAYQFILAAFRVRRFLHIFAKSSGIQFDPKNLKKILADIESARKRLTVLMETECREEETLVQGVFFDDLNKTIRAHFGPRESRLMSFKESLLEIKNVFDQFELMLPVPTKISELSNRVVALEASPVNAWPRSYLKVGIFPKDDFIFSSVKTEDIIMEDINDWVHLKEDVKSNEKFKQLMRNGAPAISESIYRLLGNSMRWFWDNSRVYDDHNVLTHMASEVDSEVTNGNR